MRDRSQADRREAMIGERLMWPTGPVRGPRRVAHRVLANRPIFPCFPTLITVSRN